MLRALWSGETVDYDGTFHHLRGATQVPGPVDKIPVVIGGTGPKTLALVREYADWWNVPVTHLDLLERSRSLAGDARVSIQQTVAFVGRGADRDAVAEAAARRFRHMPPVTGTGTELVDHFGRLADEGIERVYAWFSDFAPPDTLAAFGAEVIGPLSRIGLSRSGHGSRTRRLARSTRQRGDLLTWDQWSGSYLKESWSLVRYVIAPPSSR